VHSHSILNSIFTSSCFYTGCVVECRFSENGESITPNILLQGNPEILDAVKYFDDMKQPVIDMDMSYTRVLHIKVAYRVPHK
jgi:hypothetical protein